MRKRIPTLLALTLLIASIAFGIFIFNVHNKNDEQLKNTSKPQDITIANITENSATLIWHTSTPVIGLVRLSNGQQYTDDRDNPAYLASRLTHYVTIPNLQPNTTYQAEIENNKFIYADQKVTLTTLNSDVSEKAAFSPGLHPVRGTVLHTALEPANEAIIVLNLKDTSPKATFVTTAGNYILPTTKLVNSTLTDTVQLPPSPQPATLEIRSGNRVSFAQITLPIKDHILPAITLGKNENFTAFLSQPAPTPIALEFRPKTQNYDLNNDGKVNTLDTSLISDLIARNEFNNTADFNTDNTINDADLELIKQNLE
jgi:hypothetical protein